MTAIDVMLNVVVPKMLEEELVDRLLESTDLVRGFTSYPISGHSGRMATASVCRNQASLGSSGCFGATGSNHQRSPALSLTPYACTYQLYSG